MLMQYSNVTAVLWAGLDFPNFFTAGVTVEMLMRIGLTAIAGTILGIEREKHGRAAGLRTTLLVALAACIAMILSDDFYRNSFMKQASLGTWHPDPARLAAGVLSGMGFLGAGVIIRQSNHMIRGVTTAATLWFVTMIGLAFGAGAIGVGLIATAVSVFVLVMIPYLETWIKNDWYSDLGVCFRPSECSVHDLVKALESLKVKVKGVDCDEDLDADRCEVVLHLKFKRSSQIKFMDSITSAIREVPGVSRISVKG